MNHSNPPCEAPLWIVSGEMVTKLAKILNDAPWIAIDTESNSMFAYRERVCLIQLNAGGRLFLIDPIALGDAPAEGHVSRSLEAIRPVLEDRSRIKFIHGGEYDVATLSRDFGICLAGLFDSQQAASLLGWEKTGYGALAERICGVKLAKEYTQYNWGKRPVDERAVEYAVDDVRFLPQICMQMREEIRRADLEEELDIALRAVEGMRWHGGFSPEGVWKIRGANKLSDRQMHILFALYCVRDRLAARSDRPAGQLINERVLVALAQHPAKTIHDLKNAGVKAAIAELEGQRLLTAIQNPETAAEGHVFPEKPMHAPPDKAEREREVRLREWRQKESERRGVPLAAVLPSHALLWLKSHGAGDLAAVPQLGPKRIRLYGGTLKKICGA